MKTEPISAKDELVGVKFFILIFKKKTISRIGEVPNENSRRPDKVPQMLILSFHERIGRSGVHLLYFVSVNVIRSYFGVEVKTSNS